MSSAPASVLEAWLGERFKLRRVSSDRGERILDVCPWCGKQWHCYFHLVKGKFRCMRCGEGGRWPYLVATADGISFMEARRLILNAVIEDGKTWEDARADVAPEKPGKPGKPGKYWDDKTSISDLSEVRTDDDLEPYVVPLPEEFIPCWNGVKTQMPAYLADRGTTRRQARRHGMGWCDSGRYRGRVIVPARTMGDLLWVARDATGRSSRRYLNPTGGPAGRILFNYDRIRVGVDLLVVVEGVFDALRMERAQFHAIALLGKKVGPIQRKRIFRLRPKRVIVFLDDDAWEEADAERVSSRLGGAPIVVPPAGRDAAEMTEEELKVLFAAPMAPSASFSSRVVRKFSNFPVNIK